MVPRAAGVGRGGQRLPHDGPVAAAGAESRSTVRAAGGRRAGCDGGADVRYDHGRAAGGGERG